LADKPFKIITDHLPLKNIFHLKNPTDHQMARFVDELQGYDFTIEHRAGKRHCNADYLSRKGDPEEETLGGTAREEDYVNLLRTIDPTGTLEEQIQWPSDRKNHVQMMAALKMAGKWAKHAEAQT